MKPFLNNHFLLTNQTAIILYQQYAQHLPIIDYHCHQLPHQIAADYQFENITQAWLYGDHYKWRAMRAFGINEAYITGNKTDEEKFIKWAETVPYTLRNPLFHWTHLELQRYFGIDEFLNQKSAQSIYERCNVQVQLPSFSVKNLLRKMKVQVVCTTDDPTDSLEHHQQIIKDGFEIKILPAYRPDKAMNVDNATAFNAYVAKLEAVCNCNISTYQQYTDALLQRHHFFATMGCTVSDHGLEQLYAAPYTDADIDAAFQKIRMGKELSMDENIQFKSAMLYQFALWDYQKNWVQQYHLGALRNNNTRMLRTLGPDTGWDSIGDFSQAKSMASFLNRLDSTNQLAKTIIYNLNPADNELMATMIGNYNDGSVAGKVQYGAAWWFLDQKDGMIKQLNALSNMGLLSKFVGMLTDSRSFLSYPRHEYFRRLLCNLFGTEMEKGELPNDLEWIGSIISDICYHNTKNYFGW